MDTGFSQVVLATSASSRLRGLLGAEEFDAVLLLAPCSDIHTFGMTRNLDVAFLDSTGTIVKTARGVEPRKRIRSPKAVAVLERFSSKEPWFSKGDSLRIGCRRFAGEEGESK